MIVKRQTWLNNTKRYRAHTYIYIFTDYVGIIWSLGDVVPILEDQWETKEINIDMGTTWGFMMVEKFIGSVLYGL